MSFRIVTVCLAIVSLGYAYDLRSLPSWIFNRKIFLNKLSVESIQIKKNSKAVEKCDCEKKDIVYTTDYTYTLSIRVHNKTGYRINQFSMRLLDKDSTSKWKKIASPMKFVFEREMDTTLVFDLPSKYVNSSKPVAFRMAIGRHIRDTLFSIKDLEPNAPISEKKRTSFPLYFIEQKTCSLARKNTDTLNLCLYILKADSSNHRTESVILRFEPNKYVHLLDSIQSVISSRDGKSAERHIFRFVRLHHNKSTSKYPKISFQAVIMDDTSKCVMPLYNFKPFRGDTLTGLYEL